MDKFEQRMDALEQRSRMYLEQRMDALEAQIDLMAGELHEIKDQLKAVDSRADVATLKIRVGRVEKRLKTKLA